MRNFKKIVLTIMLGVLVLLPSAVYAKTEVKSEEELKTATKNGGDIVLQNDITLKSALEIKGSNVIIDLNGKTITVDEKGYFDLFEGKLEFTGTGKIKDIRVRDKVASTIWVEGSNDKTAKDFSTPSKESAIASRFSNLLIYASRVSLLAPGLEAEIASAA